MMTTKPSFNPDDLLQRLLANSNNVRNPPVVVMTEKELLDLLLAARAAFMAQAPLLELDAPVKICGDTHGQYGDVLRLFSYAGFPPSSNYLFMGDYVDRGKQSIETIVLLFCYKLKYPTNFLLIRGNHECSAINRIYGFYEECKRRFSIKIWKRFQDVFNCMPLAAVVSNRIFCMHGGISPDLKSWEQIRRIQRPTEIPDSGLMCDLLWSDPDKAVSSFVPNVRGVSYCFGVQQVLEFCETMDLDLIARAHQVVEDGYEFFANRHLVTVFSAPNYCGQFDNAGAVMSVDEHLMCAFQILTPMDKKRKVFGS